MFFPKESTKISGRNVFAVVVSVYGSGKVLGLSVVRDGNIYNNGPTFSKLMTHITLFGCENKLVSHHGLN